MYYQFVRHAQPHATHREIELQPFPN